MPRWLITGGCGFIGRNLIRRLAVSPTMTIRVIDDLSVGTREALSEVHAFKEYKHDTLTWESDGRVQLVVGDIRDAALAERVAGGTDVIVHLAANTGVAPSVADPRNDCLKNVIGTLNYLEAAKCHGVKRFVFASSGASIGDCEPPLHEELPAHPLSPYGASKLAGEAYCSVYNRCFGIETVMMRFGNCYGPLSSHKSSIVAKFIREALARQPWEIYGDGRQTRDFIFVEDIVEAIQLAAVAEGVGGEIFQIATTTETTVLELADKLAQVLRRRGIAPPSVRHRSRRTGDVARNYSDTTKARMRLGWTARFALDEGLDRTVRWYSGIASSA
jgi:UDP-glucose 4-epimerase